MTVDPHTVVPDHAGAFTMRLFPQMTVLPQITV
jgi:hypothetical protein